MKETTTMKFRIYNHRAPAEHPNQNAEVDADRNTFPRMVLAATGGGMSEQATAKALVTDQQLRELPLGGCLRLHAKYLDLRLNTIEVDATFTKSEV